MNKHLFYYTSNGTVEPKGFDKTLYVPSTQVITNEKGQDIYVDKYSNYLNYLLDTSLSNNLHQVSTGLNHAQRNCFVVDSDNNATPELLDGIFSLYFVKPSLIMRNPKSGHCQTFFIFDKPIHTHSINYGANKIGKEYQSLSKQLNSFFGLGDINFKGWWCKNPLSFDLYKYSSFNTYDYEFLKEQIEKLDQYLTWTEVPKVITLKRELLVTDNDNELGIDIEHYEPITMFVPTFEPIETEHKDDKETEKKTKVVKEIVKKETCKKNNKTENRHNILYKFMVCYSKQHHNVIDYKDLYNYLSFYNNLLFNVPLTPEEINRELMNKKTLDSLRHILDYAAYQKERSKRITNDYYNLCIEMGVDLTNKKEITKCLKENTDLKKSGISKQVKKIMNKDK